MIKIISLINCSVDVHTISLLVVFLANIEIACGSRICTMVPAHLFKDIQRQHLETVPTSKFAAIKTAVISCLAEALPRVGRKATTKSGVK